MTMQVNMEAMLNIFSCGCNEETLSVNAIKF